MLHITCDRCGKEVQEHEDHYIVKIEVFAAHDPAGLTEADLDEDHVEAVSELLRDMEDVEDCEQLEPASRQFRYDLCPGCRKKYTQAPLAKEAAASKLHFSEN
jgi:hypothetical protein